MNHKSEENLVPDSFVPHFTGFGGKSIYYGGSKKLFDSTQSHREDFPKKVLGLQMVFSSGAMLFFKFLRTPCFFCAVFSILRIKSDSLRS